MVCVSWRDARAYVQWLSEKTGKGYRLPSESEWEYAAQGGWERGKPWFWGDGHNKKQYRYANGADRSTIEYVYTAAGFCNDNYAWTAPVGSYKPNNFGLYDVLGNAAERVEDCFRPGEWQGGDAVEDYRGAPLDGSAWMQADCHLRRLRGGFWAGGRERITTVSRGLTMMGPTYPSRTIGIRVARILTSSVEDVIFFEKSKKATHRRAPTEPDDRR